MNNPTNEQAQLLVQIVSQLDNSAVTGEWPEQECKYCGGHSDGYCDSREFRHNDDCIVPLIQQLRETAYTRIAEV